MSRLSSRFGQRLGAETLTLSNPTGRAVSASPRPRWRHPWFTQPLWDSSAGQWLATVLDGYLNARCPVFIAAKEEQERLGNPSETHPLTGDPFPAGDVALPLYLSPRMPMVWRSLGWDGEPDLPVPQYFLDRGVAPAPKLPSAEEVAAGGSFDVPQPPAGLRLLRACDLWLHQPRSSISSLVDLQPGPVLGQSNVTQTLTLRGAAASDRLRVVIGRQTRPPASLDPLTGDYEEATFDEILISTVYVLSPLNTPSESEPTAGWTPFVRHNLFWNLTWGQPAFRQLPGEPGSPGFPPLAGGVAQHVINFLAADNNDANEQVLANILAASMAGHFWTATGGGHDGTLPAVTFQVLKPANGLDKAATLDALASAANAAARAQRLDPPFPYVAEAFSLSLLDR